MCWKTARKLLRSFESLLRLSLFRINDTNYDTLITNVSWTPALSAQWQDLYNNAARPVFFGGGFNLSNIWLPRIPAYVDLKQANCTAQQSLNSSNNLPVQCALGARQEAAVLVLFLSSLLSIVVGQRWTTNRSSFQTVHLSLNLDFHISRKKDFIFTQMNSRPLAGTATSSFARSTFLMNPLLTWVQIATDRASELFSADDSQVKVKRIFSEDLIDRNVWFAFGWLVSRCFGWHWQCPWSTSSALYWWIAVSQRSSKDVRERILCVQISAENLPPREIERADVMLEDIFVHRFCTRLCSFDPSQRC